LAGIALSTSGRQVIAYICDGNARYLTLAQWFTGPVLGLLSGPGARGLQANAEGSWGGPISVALAQIYDPANNPAQPGVTLNDQVDALVGLLRGLRDQLVIAMRDEPAQAGLGEALQAFLDVSHTIGMSAVTTLENAIRDQTGNADPFSVTFNELFLRDRVSLLHDLAGDVPRELFLSDQDAPFDYLRTATAHLVLGIDVPGRGRMDAPDVMRELVQDLDMAKRLLDGNPTVDEFIAAVERRDSAILHLAVVAQTLGSETTRLVTLREAGGGFGANAAGATAVALAGLLPESMRGLLGLPERGTARITPADVDDLLPHARERARPAARRRGRQGEERPARPRPLPARAMKRVRKGNTAAESARRARHRHLRHVGYPLRPVRGREADGGPPGGRTVDLQAMTPADDRRVAAPPPVRDLPGQRVPGGGVIAERIEHRRIAVADARITGVVGVGQHERHPAALAQDPGLAQPGPGIGLLQDGVQGVVLRHRDRQFHHVLVEVGQVRAAATRLRLIRVGVAVGGVVLEAQARHQVPVPLGRG
jgi:hypothetical protein